MNTDIVNKIYLEYLIGSKSDKEIIDWALKHYQSNRQSDFNTRLLEIAVISPNSYEISEVSGLLEKLVNDFSSNFHDKKEKLAMEILKDHCDQLILGIIRPYDLCKIIGQIESIFDFPKWLGNLWNLCDWCEPDTEVNEYLISEAKNRSKDLNKLLEEKNEKK